MGLDQFAFSRTAGSGEDGTEIAYWRKHNRLQGWMNDLWEKQGNDGSFNCVNVVLTIEDIDALEEAINNKALPETQGFFFGNDSYEDYEEWGYKEQDEQFITRARELIAAGQEVYYTCWW
jgi:hypothetical protein